MIHRDRATVNVPTILSGKNEAGPLERAKAIAFYAIKANAGKKFLNYKAYGDESVKEQLNQLFFDKCAYCEMGYGGAPLDTEHFRPKGAITEWCATKKAVITLKPGYYWLAASWENLLPSCIDCNRPRGHEFSNGKRVAGKANFFPIVAGSKRASRPNQESQEQRLLIDPCIDNPESLLRFSRDGLVVEKYKSGKKYEKAKRSIEHFGLRRVRLVERREAHAIDVMDHIQRINRSLADLAKHPGSKRAKAELDAASKLLDGKIADRAPFLALTRCLIREHLSRV